MSGREPHIEERGRIDLLRFAMGGRLVEHGRQAGEELHEDRDGNLVHRDCHGSSSCCCDALAQTRKLRDRDALWRQSGAKSNHREL